MMLGGEGGQAGVREVPELYNKGGGCSSLRPGTVKGSRLAGGRHLCWDMVGWRERFDQGTEKRAREARVVLCSISPKEGPSLGGWMGLDCRPRGPSETCTQR